MTDGATSGPGGVEPGGAGATERRTLFSSRAAAVMATVGVAIGLGNFWRFPYLAGRFGGAAFVAFYVLCVVAIGVPAVMAEWTLGRETRRGPVGAYARAGLPFGRAAGWFFFVVVAAAMAYYSVAVGWVLAFAVGQAGAVIGARLDAAAVLPPDAGFEARSLALQVIASGVVLVAAAAVVAKGLRAGIERASRLLVPALGAILLLVIVRSLTLPGAGAGLSWYLFKVDWSGLTGRAMAAALGQAIFSLSLGGTFMVVYGSYMNHDVDLRSSAVWHAFADTGAGLLAGLAIFPAVFALGLEPDSGPGLIFDTLPRVFDAMPGGALFGLLFFLALLLGAFLADVAALEVLVAGLTDTLGIDRRRAVRICLAIVFVLAVPPMISMRIFVPWDLAFGSGVQTFGALLAVVTVGWCLSRARALSHIAAADSRASGRFLLFWLRFVVPAGILLVWIWWALTDLLGVVTAA
ncbi:MAG: sodium-dependent transporter [Gemmatimonadota bacterium]